MIGALRIGHEDVPFCGGDQTACQSCGGGAAAGPVEVAASAPSLVALPLPLAAVEAGFSSSESDASSTVAAGGLDAGLEGAAEVEDAAEAAAGGEAAELAGAGEAPREAAPSAVTGGGFVGMLDVRPMSVCKEGPGVWLSVCDAGCVGCRCRRPEDRSSSGRRALPSLGRELVHLPDVHSTLAPPSRLRCKDRFGAWPRPLQPRPWPPRQRKTSGRRSSTASLSRMRVSVGERSSSSASPAPARQRSSRASSRAARAAGPAVWVGLSRSFFQSACDS
jgi:hypothetical protein